MGKPRSLKVTLAFWPSIIFSLFILGLVVASTSIYSLRVKSTNYAQVQATSEQILANYETYFSSSVGISDAILSRYATTDPEAADSLTPFFDDIREITPEILSISLYRCCKLGSLLTSLYCILISQPALHSPDNLQIQNYTFHNR